MSNIYDEKGYGARSVGFGERLGILVVDFQKGFIDRKFRMGGSPHIDGAVESTAELLKVARARGVPVANCYVAYPSQDAVPYWKVETVRELIRGSEHCELDPRIVDPTYDFVFEKHGASAFFMSPCLSWLTKKRVDTVAVTGCVTSGCVRASVVDAFQFGFRTQLVADCSGDMDEGPHQDTLRDVGRRYADIVSSEDVIRHIMANKPQT